MLLQALLLLAAGLEGGRRRELLGEHIGLHTKLRHLSPPAPPAPPGEVAPAVGGSESDTWTQSQLDYWLKKALTQRGDAPKFGSPNELETWLNMNRVKTKRWGMDQAKSVADLWEEVFRGEARLHLVKDLDGGVQAMRGVSVLSVRVRRAEGPPDACLSLRNPDLCHLVEIRQVFPDGREYTPGEPLGVKLKKGDIYSTAMYKEATFSIMRELGELNIQRDEVEIVESSFRQSEQVSDAYSYPTLPCKYTVYRLDAAVRGLPAVGFRTKKYKECDWTKMRCDPDVHTLQFTAYWDWEPDKEDVTSGLRGGRFETQAEREARRKAEKANDQEAGELSLEEWLQEYQAKLSKWWREEMVLTSADRKGMADCISAIGLHAASRLSMLLKGGTGAAPPPAPAQQSMHESCEGVTEGASEKSMQLPEFPNLPDGFVPPLYIPNLLPAFERMLTPGLGGGPGGLLTSFGVCGDSALTSQRTCATRFIGRGRDAALLVAEAEADGAVYGQAPGRGLIPEEGVLLGAVEAGTELSLASERVRLLEDHFSGLGAATGAAAAAVLLLGGRYMRKRKRRTGGSPRARIGFRLRASSAFATTVRVESR